MRSNSYPCDRRGYKTSNSRLQIIELLMETILKDRSKVSPEQTPCYNMSWLSIYDGLVFKGKRLVVPQGLRAEIKKDIRASHAGVDGCLRRARESVYWPGMNSELRHWISTCEPCRLFETSHGKEKREKIAVDLFTQNQLQYSSKILKHLCLFPLPNVDLGITVVSVLQNTCGSTLGREKAHFGGKNSVK